MSAPLAPVAFRAALAQRAFVERDAWVDRLLGLEGVPDDGPALPREGVPYLPAPVDALTHFVALARLGPDDLVLDVGAGVGRAAAVLHWLSGARVIGVEAQPQLVTFGAAMLARAQLTAVELLQHDAHGHQLEDVTAYFLYCPFSGAQLEAWIDRLPRKRPTRLGFLDVPAPRRPWLEPLGSHDGLEVVRASPT